MYVRKYKYTRTYGGKSWQGHQVLAACEERQQPGRAQALPSSQDSRVLSLLSNFREHFTPYHVYPQPAACPPSQHKIVKCHHKTLSALPFDTYMLCPKHSLQKTALSEVIILPLFPSLNRQSMFSLVPTLSVQQCLSLPELLMPLCPLDHSFQLSARLQKTAVLSKTLHCYCLMRAVRNHHTKKSGHQRKFKKWPQLSAFWRCLHLLTSNLRIRCPMLSTGISAVFSQLPSSSLSPAG